MARICYKCTEYDASGTLQMCPTCNVPMQFTLLPPQDGPVAAMATPEAMPQLATRRPSTMGGSPSVLQSLGFALRFRWLAGLVLIPVLVLGGFLGLNLGTGSSLKTRYDQIKVGMAVAQVEKILNPPTYYKGRPMPQHHLLDGIPDEGPYSIEYTEEGFGTITLDFEDGVLAAKSHHVSKQGQ